MAIVQHTFSVLVSTRNFDENGELHEMIRDDYYDETGHVVPIEKVFTSSDDWTYAEPQKYDDHYARIEGTAAVHDPHAEAQAVAV